MLERVQILICGGTGCLSSGSKSLRDEFKSVLTEMNLINEVRIVLTGCFGLCEKGPVVIVYPEETFYSHIKVSDVRRICEEHILKGRVVKELLFQETNWVIAEA